MALSLPLPEVAAQFRAGTKARDLARKYRCSLPAMYKALRRAGVGDSIRGYTAPAYRKKAAPKSAALTREPIGVDCLPRVDRDPCSYCGVRRDIGCSHNRRAA